MKRTVKILSVLLTFVMVFQFFPSAVCAQADDNLANSDYINFNLETRETTGYSFDDLTDYTGGLDYACSPGYFPNGVELPSNTSPSAIVDNDSRIRVNPTTTGPYCSTVYLRVAYSSGYVFVASGFMIGPSAVGTAAHCLYDRTHGLPSSVTVVPAKNGSLQPYGGETVSVSGSATNLVIPNEFIAFEDAFDSRSKMYDWAIIELNRPLGNSTGWLGIRYQAASYNGTWIWNSGYPHPDGIAAQNSSSSYMFVGEGSILNSDNVILEGNWDATSGNSGGPVYAYYNSTGYTLIGILTTGDGANGGSYPASNSGALRITQALYNLFLSYR